jgi:hypothetical protein
MLSGYIFELYAHVCKFKNVIKTCVFTPWPPGEGPASQFCFCRWGTASLWRPQLYI